ncbi:PREDICTED: Werner Syndrome-like exonuclease [Erythranthe guttata]|uniref:Werner Syndrome-like exonuclease n=1 Tax=Erythranthe guttata TaxID=4155 RepID=UPI00064DCC8C|nr:PREDICTED: Werner Syndrome-like exonuclease [Erythranthe guttata]|eukprot:XP_012837885.1 PREDICTED: Werner Syndrome-like exonuclease [Erythranthe guttata]
MWLRKVTFLVRKVHVTVTKEARQVHEWILSICSIHIDFSKNLLIDFIPVSLHAFLADPRHTFCGVGIKDDVDKLYDHHKLRVRKIADLNDLARLATINSQSGNGGYKYMGLKKMAYAVLGKKMEKPLNVTLSKWDTVELDRDQIEYAAIDAVVSYQLGYTLCSPIYRPQPGSIVVGRPGLLLV